MASSALRPRHSFWRDFAIAVTGAFLGTFLGYALPTFFHNLNSPPPDSTVIRLMDEDVRAALHHDGTIAYQIYATNGVIIDAACGQASNSQVVKGLENIKQRYDTLPRFASLAHVNTHVTWIPDDKSATQATARADTQVALEGGGKSTAANGREQWVFELIGGQWLITSFTYNLCLPQSS